MSDTASILREFIRENFLFGQNTAFSDDDSFLGLGIIDSTGVLELVALLETRFQIRVADDELVPENLDSIENLVRFIEMKREGEALEASCSSRSA
jgi:acyl carrier protein